MREFKKSDKVTFWNSGHECIGEVVQICPMAMRPVVVYSGGKSHYFSMEGRYFAKEGVIILKHVEDKPKKETPMNETPKLEITKDNIWDIVDEKYKYIFVNAKGIMYATDRNPTHKTFTFHDFDRRNPLENTRLNIKVTPWWADWMTSLIERPKATREFKVGDKVELRLENTYEGRVEVTKDSSRIVVHFSNSGGWRPHIRIFTKDGRIFETEPVVLFHVES